MICPTKLPRIQKTTSSIDKAFALPNRNEIKIEEVLFTPSTAGPFLVPVTRWIE
jgi:hypothetical protein